MRTKYDELYRIIMYSSNQPIKDKLDGRPVNGMFTAVSKKLKIKAKDVSPASDRIQGVLLEEEGDSILIVNVYFPADPKTKTYG